MLYYCPNCFTAKEYPQLKCIACLYVPETDNPTYLKPEGRIHQQYLVGRVLGHGGFGITYLAFDVNLKTRVAIKEYFPSTWASRAHDSTIHPHTGSKGALFEKGKASFIEEARMLTQFHGTHIIRVLNLFEALGTAYYVMEYLEGETLKSRIERNGPLSFREAEKIINPLMSALDEIHSQQVYHRDIKPENIYLTENRGPILLDFGAARYHSANESRSLTAVLTPGYAPVEQYFSTGKQGAWTDIYALAATGYYILSGKAPSEATERSQTGAALPALSSSRIEPAQEQWLLNGLAVRHEDRPQSIAQWRQMYEQGQNLSQTRILSEIEQETELKHHHIKPTLTITKEKDANAVESRSTLLPLIKNDKRPLIIVILLLFGGICFTGINLYNKRPVPEQNSSQVPLSEASASESLNKTEKNVLGMEFVRINPGRFTMGSQGEGDSDETAHKVEISQAFYIQTTPVTQAQWFKVMGENPSKYQNMQAPVERVSWDDVQSFITKLDSMNAGHYRLPTEAEWEYACKADAFTQPIGLSWQEYAWYKDNSNGTTHPVGQKQPNNWGLYDMHGNVWEWVEDKYGDYQNHTVTDPTGPTTGDLRVHRGGSWLRSSSDLRCANREAEKHNYKDGTLGFRLVKITADNTSNKHSLNVPNTTQIAGATAIATESPVEVSHQAYNKPYVLQVASRKNYDDAKNLAHQLPDGEVVFSPITNYYAVVSGGFFSSKEEALAHLVILNREYHEVGTADDIPKAFARLYSDFGANE